MTLEVRRATHDDVAAIRAVGETTWPPAGSAEWPDTVWMLRPATAEQAPPDAS